MLAMEKPVMSKTIHCIFALATLAVKKTRVTYSSINRGLESHASCFDDVDGVPLQTLFTLLTCLVETDSDNADRSALLVGAV